ncbi:Pyruvate/Phosphoenolpyruvate kinase-like domain-containing protein [Aspergillus desertorum]
MAGHGSLAGLMPYSNANGVVVEMASGILPVVMNARVIDRSSRGHPAVPGAAAGYVEETGMGYDKKAEMTEAAHELDLLTTPYVFNVQKAEDMTRAGADVLVAYGTCDLGDSVKTNADVILPCLGGPIAAPKDARFALERVSGLHRSFGASSMERLSVKVAIKDTPSEFKKIELKK